MPKRGVALAVIMDDEMIRRALMRIAHQISERHRGIEGLVLVGVLKRGTPMAHRIADNLARIEGSRPPVESIDVGTYRDDRERTRVLPAPWRARQLVDNQVVILVDDVLFTGRTVRAALDAIIDGGRPRRIEPILQGRAIVTWFLEPSTRTWSLFELAAKYLGAGVVSMTDEGTSVVKGETLWDTVINLQAMGIDAVVVWHQEAGVPWQLARRAAVPVINAGDGWHEHPTQGLLDLLTVKQRLGGIRGLKVAIVGDVWHSRVARSDIWGLTRARLARLRPHAVVLHPGPQNRGVEIDSNVMEAEAVQITRQVTNGVAMRMAVLSRIVGGMA